MRAKIGIFRRFARTERAVSSLEYAILVGVMVAVVAAALVVFSNNTTPVIEGIGTKVGAMRAPDTPELTP